MGILFSQDDRFLRRSFKHRGTVRPDISEGCTEKVDIEILKYIIFDYPNKRNQRQRLFAEAVKVEKNYNLIYTCR
jgi:hypothetical protein